MDLVDPSMKESCEKYVKKCGGPYNVFRAEENKTPMSYLDEAFKPLQ